jgi:hypothetical protein
MLLSLDELDRAATAITGGWHDAATGARGLAPDDGKGSNEGPSWLGGSTRAKN